LISKNVREYISLSSGHVVMEMVAPRSFVGNELQELALPTRHGVNVIAIRYNSLTVTDDGRNVVEKKINDMPGANDMVNEGDVLIMMGPKANVDRLIHETTVNKD